MTYRWEVSSREGLVQQLASNILPHGYWFYVTGMVPVNKDPRQVDQKLMWKYGVRISRQQRVRRKQAGLANLHYLRYRQFWVLLATHGEHAFFEEESSVVRDIRTHPLRIEGYSLTVKRGDYLQKARRVRTPNSHQRSSCETTAASLVARRSAGPDATDLVARRDGKMRSRVLIAREEYLSLLAWFEHRACRSSVEQLSQQLRLLPWEPYAPIRRQYLNLLRVINHKRHTAGLPGIPVDVLRYKRRVVKVFVGE